MKKLFILFLFVLGFIETNAQTTKTNVVTLTINNILELDFDNTTQNLGLTFVTAADFESGKTNLLAAGLRVRSNKNWTVSAKANSANFTASAGGDANVAANTLSVRRNGTTNPVALTTTDQTLATGTKGGFGTNTFQIDYIANPGYIAPATYTLGVTFTVTAP
jgi:uncharacterized membrane protein YdcZ (DUF606 family)